MTDNMQPEKDASGEDDHEKSLFEMLKSDERFKFLLENPVTNDDTHSEEDSKPHANKSFLDRAQEHISKGQVIPIEEFSQEELNHIFAVYVQKVSFLIDHQILSSKVIDDRLNAHLDLGKTYSQSLLYLFGEVDKIHKSSNVPQKKDYTKPIIAVSLASLLFSAIALFAAFL
jgi:hypothetical protein